MFDLSGPSRQLRAVVLWTTAAWLGGCSKQGPPVIEGLESAGSQVAMRIGSEGRLELPADAERMAEAGWRAAQRLLGGARMVGERGSFHLNLGSPGSGVLELELRRPSSVQGQPVSVAWNGQPIGSLSPIAGWRRWSLTVPAEAVRPGRNEVSLASPMAGLEFRSARFRGGKSSVRPVPDAGPAGEGVVLWPGELAQGTTILADRDSLSLHASAAEDTEVWVGLWDVANPDDFLFEKLFLQAGASLLEPDLAPFLGRVLGFSVTPAKSTPVRLAPVRAQLGPQPDVLLCVVDTLRADHTYGEFEGLETPAFARLQRDGVAFSSAFAHAPMTLPSHTSLFSSRFPHQTGVTNNYQLVPSSLPLLAEWLTAAGFACEASISLGTLWTPLPYGLLKRGFERFQGTESIERGDWANDQTLPVLESLTERRPFFLFAHYSDPHEPYNTRRHPERSVAVRLPGLPSEEVPIGTIAQITREVELGPGRHELLFDSDTFFRIRHLHARDGGRRIPVSFSEGELGGTDRRARASIQLDGLLSRSIAFELWIHDVPETRDIPGRYREEVVFADREVGRLLDQLDRAGLYESTLIVFTSDHGESLGEHRSIGHAQTLFDPELHVPLIIKLPAGHPGAPALEAASESGLARHVDVVPTILEVLGLPPLPGQMGRSLLGEAERLHFAETHEPESPRDLYALRDLEWKLIFAPKDGKFELYDLVADPGETQDVYSCLLYTSPSPRDS